MSAVSGTRIVQLEGGATLHDDSSGLAKFTLEEKDSNDRPCYKVEVGRATCLLPGSREITVNTDCSGIMLYLKVTAQTGDGPKTFDFPLMSSLHQKRD